MRSLPSVDGGETYEKCSVENSRYLRGFEKKNGRGGLLGAGRGLVFMKSSPVTRQKECWELHHENGLI